MQPAKAEVVLTAVDNFQHATLMLVNGHGAAHVPTGGRPHKQRSPGSGTGFLPRVSQKETSPSVAGEERSRKLSVAVPGGHRQNLKSDSLPQTFALNGTTFECQIMADFEESARKQGDMLITGTTDDKQC